MVRDPSREPPSALGRSPFRSRVLCGRASNCEAHAAHDPREAPMALHFGHRSRRGDALATTSYVAFVLALAMGCGDDDGDSIDSGAPEDAAVVLDAATEDAGETALDAGADAGPPAVCEPHELTCVDQHIAGLGLLEDP